MKTTNHTFVVSEVGIREGTDNGKTNKMETANYKES
jgi:uncharacterized protein YheU (UPF0270 family)